MDIKDKRVLRTREAFNVAFEDLALTNAYHNITVTNLAQHAGVNRKTFYLHYNSINELVEGYTSEVTKALVKIIKNTPFTEVYAHPGILLDDFTTVITQHSKLYQKILYDDEYSLFVKRIERTLSQALAKNICEAYPITAQNASVVAHFMINNTIFFFNYFQENRNNAHFDLPAFRAYVSKLNIAGLSTFLPKQG